MLDKIFDLTKPFAKSMEYPKEYNPRVHGAYNPSINYARNEPLSQVKLAELGSWFGRRDFSLTGIRAAASRALWKYRLKYIEPKKANAAVIYHFVAFAFTINYLMYEYPERKKHRWALYH